MGSRERRWLLKHFLNKECLWVKNSASTAVIKVYTSTTARSPLWPGRHAAMPGIEGPINVTVQLMKPKDRKMCATFYVNGVFVDSCTPTAFYCREVQRYGIYLLFFGDLVDPEPPNVIPENIAVHKNEPPVHLTILQMVNSATLLKTPDDLPKPHVEVVPLGPFGPWMANGSLLQYTINPDLLICCPSIGTLPTMSNIITWITKCENEECESCHGNSDHACVLRGVTLADQNYGSDTCPCVAPCSMRHGNIARITTSSNLLGFLFPPESQNDIVAIRAKSNKLTLNVQDIFCGVTREGEEVACLQSPWLLFGLSHLVSRMVMYGCESIKRKCLRSY
ncbi:ORF33 [Alcelaphine gammaherpesvirus 1]|uniref:Cytoplasmic envelopment protein 2 n=1 Tax=Alcelaphine herpesvirus 1 (strain C500) TaxID=654901 RepID=CEP2_ALHV1|nr:ORF33 [Alcelaphine gammaherpesvirus 1]O36382.1 RecName: Full=Cytoplasmic envelopment protein 2 [Alcelaphine herpesvirus 1 strain C500]AAC58079.1 ORF33 [Alcelaphine gammaherpesvirus 1]APB09457.1 tegument protein UL16 [Alcelaphine gammaherpesvirus 1]APB09529.1 tegument protein UL16 [Alcelaphine gammaherpesvirus 1]ATI21920.1 ORF33 [Alcelaphine gammaherpesvirus 1]QDY92265.1 tegument protein UL16 [Alcelaphine gammaherpesvirus 1]